MNAHVLDAYAMMAYLEKEKGYDRVAEILGTSLLGNKKILISVINVGEVYYTVWREQGVRKADEIMQFITGLPISLVDANLSTAKEAAFFKASFKMSYADCFGAAVAKQNKAVFVTGDPEFRQIEHLIKIEWL